MQKTRYVVFIIISIFIFIFVRISLYVDHLKYNNIVLSELNKKLSEQVASDKKSRLERGFFKIRDISDSHFRETVAMFLLGNTDAIVKIREKYAKERDLNKRIIEFVGRRIYANERYYLKMVLDKNDDEFPLQIPYVYKIDINAKNEAGITLYLSRENCAEIAATSAMDGVIGATCFYKKDNQWQESKK